MTFLLTVSFFVFTAVWALLTLADKTWAKDKPVASKRILWGCFACIIVILGVNIWKEYLVSEEKISETKKNAEAQGKLQGTIDTQNKQIEGLRTELSEVRTKLSAAEVALKKTAEGVQQYVYPRLYRETYGFLQLLSNMIEDASDGWLPSNETEFFSRRSINLICRELNTDGEARVLPPMPWSMWFARRIRGYQAVLEELIKAYPNYLDTTLFAQMSKLRDSQTFSMIVGWQDARYLNATLLRNYPPVFCWEEQVVAVVEKDFASLRDLFSEIVKGAKKLGTKIVAFPLPSRKEILGRNRFSPEQLSKWQKEHPVPAAQ